MDTLAVEYLRLRGVVDDNLACAYWREELAKCIST